MAANSSAMMSDGENEDGDVIELVAQEDYDSERVAGSFPWMLLFDLATLWASLVSDKLESRPTGPQVKLCQVPVAVIILE
ncbi:hypothetical protein RRG08_047625 [Elysia crispata]|uniref:Uncharacterized protein n=1 Tax=Elysia crispata TaxID=231223 RepID=A0AAE1BDI9_9GAST|nr:hypothetical protein RRG08_047625 [Elysia crispata]